MWIQTLPLLEPSMVCQFYKQSIRQTDCFCHVIWQLLACYFCGPVLDVVHPPFRPPRQTVAAAPPAPPVIADAPVMLRLLQGGFVGQHCCKRRHRTSHLFVSPPPPLPLPVGSLRLYSLFSNTVVINLICLSHLGILLFLRCLIRC
ncbi:hypothetical protein SLA2020_402780 [Shorea laevis]